MKEALHSSPESQGAVENPLDKKIALKLDQLKGRVDRGEKIVEAAVPEREDSHADIVLASLDDGLKSGGVFPVSASASEATNSKNIAASVGMSEATMEAQMESMIA